LDVVRQCSLHTFQFLTKNPERLIKYDFPENTWVGTSINSDKDIKRANIIRQGKAKIKYLSIEPLLGPVTFDLKGIDWIITGAKTGINPFIPKTEWIVEIIKQSNEYKIPLFFKENIKRYSNYFVQQFP